jgi:F-type H+-transporting ATPase subunit epsilon
VAATYQLRILTPSDKVLDEEVVSLVAPGEAGYLGVLANHAPILTTLKRGTLKVKFTDSEKWYEIDGGILRVAGNSAVLLSESVEEISPAS